jgi:membrane-associated phospholipid phosphatase
LRTRLTSLLLFLLSLNAFADDVPPRSMVDRVTIERIAAEVESAPFALNRPHGTVDLFRHDVRELVAVPWNASSRSWWKLAGATAAVIAVGSADDQIRTQVQETNRSGNQAVNQIASAVEPIGQEYSWLLLGGFYLAGRRNPGGRASRVAQDGLIATVLAAGVVTPTLKATFGRNRPANGDHTWDFFDAQPSFPSGHTTQAFALATVVAQHYDQRWVKIIAYGTAGLVGYARMNHDAHYASDVLAGSLIGITIGRFIVARNNERRQLDAVPIFSGKSPGVGLHVRF